MKCESLVTTFGSRACVTTLPDDISIKTTKPLAAASVVKQKTLFSFQSKPKPNCRCLAQKPEATRELEECGATGAQLFLCVLTPAVTVGMTKGPAWASCLPQGSVHLLLPHQKSPGPETQSKAQQPHRDSAGVIWQFSVSGLGTDSDWTELPDSCPSHQQKAEWSVKEYRNKLSPDCGGKTEVFVEGCRNSSSPRASAAMSNCSYRLLQQISPEQTFPLLYIALISIALHPAAHFSLYIFSLSIWQRNKPWDELL